MQSRHLVLLAVMLYSTLLSVPANSDECSFLPEEATPDWVTRPNADKAFMAAVGAARGDGQGSQAMLRNSLAAARQALAETIVSDVASETVVELSKEEGVSRESFRSVATIESSVTLRGIEAEERWLDRAECTLYTLVRIPRDTADTLAVDAMLGTLANRASDRSINYAMRRAAFDSARGALSRVEGLNIRATDLTTAARIEGLAPTFERAESTRRRTEAQLTGIRNGLESSSKGGQRRSYRELLDLTAAVNFDSEIDTGAEPVFELMARTAQSRGEICNAQRYAGDLGRFSSFSYWQAISDELLESLGSINEDCPLRLTELLGGREVDLYCRYRNGATVRQWPRMCTELGDMLRDVRALAVVKNEGDIDTLRATTQPKNGAALVAVADGTIEQQPGMGPGGGPAYRFSGQMVIRIVVNGEALYDDQFSGTTGWNPMSGDMVMDILAINLGKRLDKKLGD